MPANPDRLRFYVDESALGLGKTLAAARDDVIHTGHPLIPECPLGTLDPEWIQAVAGGRDLIVIGRDKRIRTRPAEVQQLIAAGLRVFRIGGKRDTTTWGWLTWLVRHWDEIESIIQTRGPGPWFYVIYERSIAELKFPTVKSTIQLRRSQVGPKYCRVVRSASSTRLQDWLSWVWARAAEPGRALGWS